MLYYFTYHLNNEHASHIGGHVKRERGRKKTMGGIAATFGYGSPYLG
jgi:hypothetical protein